MIDNARNERKRSVTGQDSGNALGTNKRRSSMNEASRSNAEIAVAKELFFSRDTLNVRSAAQSENAKRAKP